MVKKKRSKSIKARPKIKKAAPKSKATKKKAPAKRIKKAAPKKGLVANLEKIGEVTHYFPHVNAAAVMILKGVIKVGDKIYIKGHTSDFKETIQSMQLDHAPIEEGKKGDEIGLLVKSRVRIGDSVYKL